MPSIRRSRRRRSALPTSGFIADETPQAARRLVCKPPRRWHDRVADGVTRKQGGLSQCRPSLMLKRRVTPSAYPPYDPAAQH
jgi:hypothetical protein